MAQKALGSRLSPDPGGDCPHPPKGVEERALSRELGGRLIHAWGSRPPGIGEKTTGQEDFPLPFSQVQTQV